MARRRNDSGRTALLLEITACAGGVHNAYRLPKPIGLRVPGESKGYIVDGPSLDQKTPRQLIAIARSDFVCDSPFHPA